MNEQGTRSAWLQRCLVFAALTVPFVCIFARAWWHHEVLAFRDAGNFFYPLFAWQCQEWRAGQIPLWNPYDGLGAPALADSTSSVLYPGKLLFALPFEFATRFNLYIMGHVLLASSTAYIVARRYQCSRAGAAVCSLSYAYGGSVLFQYCNVVFLVGAAWLPLAVFHAERMLTLRCGRHAIGLGLVLALMVLGGDPQTAYHVVVLAAMGAMGQWCVRHRRGQPDSEPLPRPSPALSVSHVATRWLRLHPVLLALATISGMGLAAVQVLPTWEWTAHSDRALYDNPRSLVEAAQVIVAPWDVERSDLTRWQAIASGLFHFGSPARDTHEAKMYAYSLGPWRLVELIWPNVSGRMFPFHQRWLSAVPAEGSVWTPTLYCGLLPLLLAGSAWRWRGASVPTRWAIGLVIAGAFGSFGWYGAGWIVHELQLALSPRPGKGPWISQPVGGFYWCLVVLLPGYAYFRYPAKWFVIAAWGLSLLAGRGVENLDGNSRPSPTLPPDNPTGDTEATTQYSSLRRLLAWFGLGSLAMAGIVLAARPAFARWFQNAPPNDTFGPLDITGAWWDLFVALLHTAIVALIGSVVLRYRPLHRIAQPAWWILAVSAVDLTIANSWLIAAVPTSTFAADSTSARLWARPDERPIPQRPAERVTHMDFPPETPAAWRTSGDPQRLAQVLAWEQLTLARKHHLRQEINVVDSPMTLNSAEVRAFLDVARATSRAALSRDELTLWHAVGVGHVVSSEATADRQRNEDSVALDLRHAEARLIRLSNELPRAWLVHNVSFTQPTRTSRRSLDRHLHRMWLQDDGRTINDPRRNVYVEANQLPWTNSPVDTNASSELPVVSRYEPQQIEIDVETRSPALLVLSDLFYPGWQASIRTEGSSEEVLGDVVCVNGLLRGVSVPAGRHHVTWTYRPRSFAWGAICSLICAVFVAVFMFRRTSEDATDLRVNDI